MSPFTTDNPVFITSIGMASCVGLSADDSCASVRAGLSRFSPVDGVMDYDDDELEAPITGAPQPLLTRGFVQNAAWLRLVQCAFEDLIQSAQLPPASDSAFWQTTPVIWILPEITHERFLWPEDDINQILHQACTQALAHNLQYPLFVPANGIIAEGQSGAARAMRAMARTIAEQHFPRAIFIGVDSLLDSLCLSGLMEADRIKTQDNPMGFIPGEAAACVLVESRASCQARKAQPQAILLSAAHRRFELPAVNEDETDDPEQTMQAQNTHWRTTHAQALGLLLSQAITEALAPLGERHFAGDIILDLNGEEWRAVAWGTAQVRLSGNKRMDVEACEEIVPATSWGDIGAASGMAGLCLATRSYVRRYAKTGLSLICCLSDNGYVGAMLTSQPPR